MIRLLRDARWLTADRATAWYRVIGIVCGVAALGGLLWSLAISGGRVDPLGRPLGTDFVSFYAASELALGGDPAAAYATAPHQAAQQRAVGPITDYYAFFYPPIYLLLVLPLALLPYAPALFLWLGATGFAYWRAIGAMLGRRGPLLAMLAFPAFLANAGHGQNAALSAALFGFAALLMDRRPLLAGLCIGLLAYKPHIALLAPLVLAAAGRWRTFLAAAATVLATAAASLLVFGTATWDAFLAQAPLAATALSQEMIGSEKMVSVFAAIRILGGGPLAAYAVQACATALVALAVCLTARRADGPATGAMLAAAAPLASPFVLDYDLLIIAVPLAWAFVQARADGFLPWEKTILGAAFILPMVARSLAGQAGIPVAPLVLALLLAVIIRRVSWPRRDAICRADQPLRETAVRLVLLLAVIVFALPATARERPRDQRRPAPPAAIEPLPGTERIAMDVSGTTRRYLLHVPGGGSGPRPLVLVFHAAGSQAAQAERLSHFSALGDELGVVAAYLEGTDGQWQAQQDPRSEITFTRMVVEDILRRTPIDRRRIFAAGVSGGAAMAAALGCFAPEVVAGVALIAGTYVSPCHNSPRAPAILFNGAIDTPAGARRAGMPARDVAAAWGSGPGCRAGAESLPARGALRVDRFACGGAQAVLWTVPGGGAPWPAAPPGPDATREIWRFFAALVPPAPRSNP